MWYFTVRANQLAEFRKLLLTSRVHQSFGHHQLLREVVKRGAERNTLVKTIYTSPPISSDSHTIQVKN
jgi:hypothetical protein